MSFGFSTGDVVLLVQLAWATVQNSRKACGEHAELTCEMTSLHVNLQRLQQETAKVESPINRPSDTCRQDLAPIVNGCRRTLDVLDRILEKYNALSDGERSKRKLWKAVRFGNGELATVKDLRSKLIYYTGNLSLFLNMVSMCSMGIVEKQMCEAGGDLKEIRRAVNQITAHLMTGASKEGSALTDYADDDKAVWRAFRRELIKEGFSSDVIREHKDTIQAYVKELGSSGILDDEDLKDPGYISEDIVEVEPTQATPKSQDEGMASFESDAGAMRDSLTPPTATTARVENSSKSGNRDPRKNGTIPPRTPIAPAPLTMKNVSGTFSSTTQADPKIDTVEESKTGEASAPITLAQAVNDSIDQWKFGPTFRYYKYDYDDKMFHFESTAAIERCFELLQNSVSWGQTLWLQAGEGFREVADLRIRSPVGGSAHVLRVSALLDVSEQFAWDRLCLLEYNGAPGRVLYGLMQNGCSWIEPDPDKWRITNWPSRPPKTKRKGHEDGDGSKRSTSTTFLTEGGQAHAPPYAASAAENGKQGLSTEESETDTDEIDYPSDDFAIVSNNKKRFGSRSTIVEKRSKQQEREEYARSIEEAVEPNWRHLGPKAKARMRAARGIPAPVSESPSPPLSSHGVRIQSTAPARKTEIIKPEIKYTSPTASAKETIYTKPTASAKPRGPFGDLESKFYFAEYGGGVS